MNKHAQYTAQQKPSLLTCVTIFASLCCSNAAFKPSRYSSFPSTLPPPACACGMGSSIWRDQNREDSEELSKRRVNERPSILFGNALETAECIVLTKLKALEVQNKINKSVHRANLGILESSIPQITSRKYYGARTRVTVMICNE